MIISGRRSSPDSRDFIYQRRPRGVLGVPVPRQIDRSGDLPPCWDQGPEGTCESHAGAAKLAELYPGFIASRLAIHYAGRKQEGTLGQDVGIETRDLMKVLQAGVISETDWQYDLTKIDEPPPLLSDVRMIGTYQRIHGADALVNHLAHDGCVVLSFDCPDTFSAGVFPENNGIFTSIGWHCVLAVGYDLDRNAIFCRNSWGPDWNIHGYFWLPTYWAVATATGDDIWSATLAPRGTVAGVEIEGAPV